MLPLLQILSADIPEADIYHTIATGYAGMLARLGGYLYNVPYMITEHGIYTREREEELIGFEPNEDMLKAIKNVYPRKVIEY